MLKREISPGVIVAALVLLVAIVAFVFWRSSMPEGVKTAKPPRVPPPGPNVSLPAEAISTPATPPGGAPGRGTPPGGAPVGPGTQ